MALEPVNMLPRLEEGDLFEVTNSRTPLYTEDDAYLGDTRKDCFVVFLGRTRKRREMGWELYILHPRGAAWVPIEVLVHAELGFWVRDDDVSNFKVAGPWWD